MKAPVIFRLEQMNVSLKQIKLKLDRMEGEE